MEKDNKPNKDFEEKRKQLRKKVDAHLTYRVIVPQGGKAETRNISERGLCLVLDKELPIGTMLEVNFDLPGKQPVPVETLVKIIWQKKVSEGFLTGLKFGT